MAQKYRVIITPEVREGSQNIVEYLEENASFAIADKVRKSLLNVIADLSKMPHRHSIVRQISDEKVTYRRVLQWNYRMIFVINEDKIEVRVIDISSDRRNPSYLEQIKDR